MHGLQVIVNLCSSQISHLIPLKHNGHDQVCNYNVSKLLCTVYVEQ